MGVKVCIMSGFSVLYQHILSVSPMCVYLFSSPMRVKFYILLATASNSCYFAEISKILNRAVVFNPGIGYLV